MLTRAPWGAPLRVNEVVLVDNHNLVATDNGRHNQRLLMDLVDEVFE